jgi:Asp-tRNA(Asn)/Glu-tRNA(Gln) amidotransferase C subunit
MSEPSIDVKYVAHLARLSLSPEEEQKFGAQLSTVLASKNDSRRLPTCECR